MLSEYTKQLLVASSISEKIKKLEKKLEKEQIEFLKENKYMWGASR